MNKEKIYIDQLLQKYWDTESSLEEEKILRDYFATDPIHPDHKEYQDLFSYFSMASLTALEKDLTPAVFAPVESPQKTGIFRLWTAKIMGIAASLILMVSAGFFIMQEYQQPHYAGKTTFITDEEEALEMTKEALAYLSIKLNKSSKTITDNVQKLETIDIIK